MRDPARILLLISSLLLSACGGEAASAEGPEPSAAAPAASPDTASHASLLDRPIRIHAGETFTLSGSGSDTARSRLHALSAHAKRGALSSYMGFGVQELARVRVAGDVGPQGVLQEIARQLGGSLGTSFGQVADTSHPSLLLLSHPTGVLTLVLLPADPPGTHVVKVSYAMHGGR